ncbi:MAG: hypothetical protein ACFFG0_06265 [Candidatus Thorarchaeota archaeon]
MKGSDYLMIDSSKSKLMNFPNEFEEKIKGFLTLPAGWCYGEKAWNLSDTSQLKRTSSTN